MRTKTHKITPMKLLYNLLLVFCMIPFVFPNPIINTDMQPYATIIGVLIILLRIPQVVKYSSTRKWVAISGLTFVLAVLLLFINGITMDAIRGVYNYFAIFIIPCAVIIALDGLKEFPEKTIKFVILLWFAVSTIQFFVDRNFATAFIAGARTSFDRGVLGLASEPSFFGISCFYFLNLINSFKKNKGLYSVMVLIMGLVYAQSATGIIFIAGYFIVYLFDALKNKKGIFIWLGAIISVFVFIYLLQTVLSDTRFARIINNVFNGGVGNILADESVAIRFSAITDALRIASRNAFLPNGFGRRIGSAYAGVLVEMGFLGIPILACISNYMSKTFKRKPSKVLYFIIITVLLFNNTQIGNPLLLLVIGMNMYSYERDKRGGKDACFKKQ